MAVPTWEMVQARPAAPLRGLIESYTGYVQRDRSVLATAEMPGTSTTLIVNFGSPIAVEAPADLAGGRVRSFASGLHRGHVVVSSDGGQRGVQLALNPLATRMLLGVPASEIARRTVSLDDLLGREAALLEERLADADDWPERFALVDAALGARLDADAAPPPHLQRAWSLIHGRRGHTAVGELAREVGCSRRHLSAGFHEHAGLGPKTVARLVRFRDALGRLSAPSDDPLGRVAADAGYADQAHFNRDFRAFTGMAPGEYLARRLPGGALAASHSSKTGGPAAP